MVRPVPAWISLAVLLCVSAPSVAAEPCLIVDRGPSTDGLTTITVLAPAAPCTDGALFAGWQCARILSEANDNGVAYEIEIRWNRAGVPSAGSFTWMKGGPGVRSVRRTTVFGAKLQDKLDTEDGVRAIEITFLGQGLETAPRNGFANLSALFADVWEWLVAEGIAEGVTGHFGSSSGSLLAANALAHHGLDRVLDGVVLGGGPFWANLRETCLDIESPTFAGMRIRRRIDKWNWDGETPCQDFAGTPEPSYDCRSILGFDARAHYPGVTVSVVVGKHDVFNPWLTAAATTYWRRIGARRKTLDRTDGGHCVLSTGESADLVLQRIREIVATPPIASGAEVTRGVARAWLESSPNPTRGGARIRFAAAAPGMARLTVHDVRGALVAELLAGAVSAGPHELTWSGALAAPPGTYFVRWATAERTVTRKLTLLH